MRWQVNKGQGITIKEKAIFVRRHSKRGMGTRQFAENVVA